MQRIIATAVFMALVGCNNAGSTNSQRDYEADYVELKSDFDALKKRVDGLENRADLIDPTAELKLGDKGFSYAPADVG